jgi:competence protein ComEC
MTTTVHLINVGQGNMTLVRAADGTTLLYDCNVTDENEQRVLSYLFNALGSGAPIDYFVNSHRDADHMRGVKKIHLNSDQ